MFFKKNDKKHWEKVHHKYSEAEVSWFQAMPRISLEMIESIPLETSEKIIDVGGGISNFADHLKRKGYSRITVLDISGKALERTKERLGKIAASIEWIESNVLDFDPPVKYGLWHDRAVFHFLNEKKDQEKYKEVLFRGLKPGGYFLISTFSLEGPRKCSGLKVKRYSTESIHAFFGLDSFEVIRNAFEEHATPQGFNQHFHYTLMKRKS